jgi:cyanate lyase
MTSHYIQLKRLLHQMDADYRYIAKNIGRSEVYVAKCMAGRLQFRIAECYAILDALGQPDADLREWFPRRTK